MLVYKALYRKMMDALKDAGMWLDWGDQLKKESPDVAKFLYGAAEERLEKDFPATHALFKQKCSEEKAEGHCLNDMVEEHMLDWYEGMMNRIKRLK